MALFWLLTGFLHIVHERVAPLPDLLVHSLNPLIDLKEVTDNPLGFNSLDCMHRIYLPKEQLWRERTA